MSTTFTSINLQCGLLLHLTHMLMLIASTRDFYGLLLALSAHDLVAITLPHLLCLSRSGLLAARIPFHRRKEVMRVIDRKEDHRSSNHSGKSVSNWPKSRRCFILPSIENQESGLVLL
jgi:hypothetical protein